MRNTVQGMELDGIIKYIQQWLIWSDTCISERYTPTVCRITVRHNWQIARKVKLPIVAFFFDCLRACMQFNDNKRAKIGSIREWIHSKQKKVKEEKNVDAEIKMAMDTEKVK